MVKLGKARNTFNSRGNPARMSRPKGKGFDRLSSSQTTTRSKSRRRSRKSTEVSAG